MTRTSMIAASAFLALLAPPAFAQNTAPGGVGAAPSATQTRATPDPLRQEDVSQIKGAAVYGADGKKIGDVSTVLMRPDTHTIERLVVGAGGVLGVGAHDVALPLSQFHWDAQKGGFVINQSEAQLKAMPSWKGAGGILSGSSAPPGSTRH